MKSFLTHCFYGTLFFPTVITVVLFLFPRVEEVEHPYWQRIQELYQTIPVKEVCTYSLGLGFLFGTWVWAVKGVLKEDQLKKK